MDVLHQMIAEGRLFTAGVEVLYSEEIRAAACALPRRVRDRQSRCGLAGTMAPPDIMACAAAPLARLKRLPDEKREAVTRADFPRLVGGGPGFARTRAPLERPAAEAARRNHAVSDQ